MPNYSIVRIGNEYIVRADEKSVMKFSSRRKAAKLISEAAELLDQQAALELAEALSNSRDPEPVEDSPEVS
jgi:hypothetical protein